MRLICVILPLVACGEDLPAPHDLAFSDDGAFFDDLASPDDLAVAASDLSGFCAAAFDGGAGACARDFFARLAECFQPAGACSGGGINSADWMCWASGASYFEGDYGLGPNPSVWVRGRQVYGQGGMFCGESLPISNAQPALRQWTLWDGSTLVVDVESGLATCADGTVVAVGSNYSACADLEMLVRPPECTPPGTVQCSPFPFPSPSPSP
jgi:hypothetical protein